MLPAKAAEILLGAQHGVDVKVVGCVVAVVGGGFKNRIQVQHGDAQSGQIIQLGGDAIERAAEKVPVSYLAVQVRHPNGLVVPILVDPTVPTRPVGPGGKDGRSGPEDLIDHTAAKPQRMAVFS